MQVKQFSYFDPFSMCALFSTNFAFCDLWKILQVFAFSIIYHLFFKKFLDVFDLWKGLNCFHYWLLEGEKNIFRQKFTLVVNRSLFIMNVQNVKTNFIQKYFLRN